MVYDLSRPFTATLDGCKVRLGAFAPVLPPLDATKLRAARPALPVAETRLAAPAEAAD